MLCQEMAGVKGEGEAVIISDPIGWTFRTSIVTVMGRVQARVG